MENRVERNHSENGFLLSGYTIPKHILELVLCKVDERDILKCNLVSQYMRKMHVLYYPQSSNTLNTHYCRFAEFGTSWTSNHLPGSNVLLRRISTGMIYRCEFMITQKTGWFYILIYAIKYFSKITSKTHPDMVRN